MLVTGFCYQFSGPLQAVSRVRAVLNSLLWCGFSLTVLTVLTIS